MKAIVSFTAALAMTATAAFAHAGLETAVPAQDATVATAPSDLMLTFSESVSLAFTGVTVTGPDGAAVPLGTATLDSAGTMLMVPVTGKLAPGVYKVEWHALSDDGHKSKGSYDFTVK